MGVFEEWGMRCPTCGADDQIHISATVILRLTPNGTVLEGGDHEWSDSNLASCEACSESGTVATFKAEGVPAWPTV